MQDAQKGHQPVLFIWSIRSVWFIWSIWSIWFVLLLDPEKPNNQINETDQTDETDRAFTDVRTNEVLACLHCCSAACRLKFLIS